ncbi:MAG: hypothetical protein KG003_09430 [Bacteroidetes bacterium]|nr:hypothetical protein [Bacteroidota bacterium]
MKFTFILFISFLAIESQAQIRKVSELKNMPEISGMIWVNHQIWTLNDGGNSSKIYRIDTTGSILDSTTFSNATNNDWEELTTNGSYVFIGDFGNNNGTRKDLKIYRFPISKLGNKNVVVDTIQFQYEGQTDFTSNPFTIYDCEAFLVDEDSIILFSKSIADAVCRIYMLPANPGNYTARLGDTISLDFWVTGACKFMQKYILTGYAFNGDLVPMLQVFGMQNHQLSKPFENPETLNLTGSVQLESVFFDQNNTLYLASEKFNSKEATLYSYTIQNLNYKIVDKEIFKVYPNPATKNVTIQINVPRTGFIYLYDDSMRQVRAAEIKGDTIQIDLNGLASGKYTIIYMAVFWDAHQEILGSVIVE